MQECGGISNEVRDEIRERCNKAGCTINDWLVALIDFHFSGSSEFDFGDEEEVEEEEKQEPQLIKIRDIPEDEPKPTSESMAIPLGTSRNL